MKWRNNAYLSMMEARNQQLSRMENSPVFYSAKLGCGFPFIEGADFGTLTALDWKPITLQDSVGLPDGDQNIVWFKFTLNSAPFGSNTIVLNTLNTTQVTNTYMALYNAIGEVLVQNSNCSKGFPPIGLSCLSYIELPAGVYYVGVAIQRATDSFLECWVTDANPPLSTASLVLNLILKPDSHPTANLGVVGVGSHTATRTLSDNYPNVVWFTFTLAGTQTVAMDTIGSEIVDTVMALYAPDGELIEQNDDCPGDEPKSCLGAQSLVAGTYMVGVSTWGTKWSLFLNDWQVDGIPPASSKDATLNLTVT